MAHSKPMIYLDEENMHRDQNCTNNFRSFISSVVFPRYGTIIDHWGEVNGLFFLVQSVSCTELARLTVARQLRRYASPTLAKYFHLRVSSNGHLVSSPAKCARVMLCVNGRYRSRLRGYFDSFLVLR